MNRLIFIMLSFLFVAFSGNICEASDKGSLKDELVHGKWMNRADGYIPKAIRAADLKPDQKARTVARYKVYSFYDDGTFTMDSIKQRYTGTWQLEGNKVIMTFNPKMCIRDRQHKNRIIINIIKVNQPEVETPLRSPTISTLNQGKKVAITPAIAKINTINRCVLIILFFIYIIFQTIRKIPVYLKKVTKIYTFTGWKSSRENKRIPLDVYKRQPLTGFVVRFLSPAIDCEYHSNLYKYLQPIFLTLYNRLFFHRY